MLPVMIFSGPLADRGRKKLMYLPFIGHFISGLVPILVVYFKSAPPQVLLEKNEYAIL